MQIAIIGTGFVGVVSAAVYASFGHKVYGLDIDEKKVSTLQNSQVPFFEPGLESLLREQQANGNLFFTTDYQEAISQSDVIMITVGTPSTPEGGADLQFVLASARSAAPHFKSDAIVVVKSTVPPGSLPVVSQAIREKTDKVFHVASVPEFLREGSAVQDTLHPERVVIGTNESNVAKILTELHEPLNAPIVVVSPSSAQMAKYAANAYLALRITFINQIADLCEKNEADVEEVITAVGYDKRIGSHYWYPGLGYGGSCFPKDVKELAYYSRTVGEQDNLFNQVNRLNIERIPKLLKTYQKKVGGWKDKTIAILGLSFKPNTDDMREAPSLSVIPELLSGGAAIKAFDPKAVTVAQSQLPAHPKLSYTTSLSVACEGADVIFLLVEWPEIVKHDFSVYRTAGTQWVIDTRNQLDGDALTRLGYTYIGMGR